MKFPANLASWEDRKMRNTMPKTAHRFQMLLGPCIIQHDQHNNASIDYHS